MQNIVAIQALRAVAAMAVAAVHLNQTGLWLQGNRVANPALYSLAAGVDLFFAISGFVMVYSSESLYGRPDGPRQFLARRLARIVAPYWLATLIAIPLMSLSFTWPQLAQSLLFIPYQNVSGQTAPLFGVGWTLNFEMFFYVLFALALFAPRWLVTPIVCTFLVAMVASRALELDVPAWWRFLSDPIVLEFVLGMLIAEVYRRGVVLPSWLRIGLIAAGACSIWFSAEHMPPSQWRVVFWGLPTAAILAGAVLGPSPSSIGRWTWLAALLGDASYSLYLVHGLCAAVLMLLWPSPFVHRVTVPTAIIWTYAATVLLSVAFHRFLERPAAAAIRRMFERLGARPSRHPRYHRADHL